MRAISMWQPWASAAVRGSKIIETRHWATDYRGPLAIHAAKRKIVGELVSYSCMWNWNGALGTKMGAGYEAFVQSLAFGAIVGVVNLVDCRRSESFTLGELGTPRRPEGAETHHYNWTEIQLGDFSPGRFGWVFENARMLKEPIPYKGTQNFFNVPDELLREVAS